MARFRERPFGEMVVELRQPIARFGMDVLFGVRLNSEIMVARVNDSGELTYEPIPHGTEHSPTLHLDDSEYEALHRAINNLPARFHGASHLDHLADAVQQRDMLISMLAQANDRNHQVVMKFMEKT